MLTDSAQSGARPVATADHRHVAVGDRLEDVGRIRQRRRQHDPVDPGGEQPRDRARVFGFVVAFLDDELDVAAARLVEDCRRGTR
jgi:hypothetical protein